MIKKSHLARTLPVRFLSTLSGGLDRFELSRNAGGGSQGIKVVERNRRAVDPREWDLWASRCGGSIRGTISHANAWSVKYALRSRLRLFELYRTEGSLSEKIGQFIVDDSKRKRTFLDRLQLVSDDDELWSIAMFSAVEHLGPGLFQYGWELSLEPRRDELLKVMEGVQVETIRPITVEAVDFSLWSTWDDYYRSVSNNSRRNAKKAQAHYQHLDLQVAQGFHALMQLPQVVRLRMEMYERKRLDFGVVKAALGGAGQVLSSPEHVFTAVAMDQRRALAGFTGVKFGGTTYYMDGGSRADNHGASWYLLLEMLRQAYLRHEDGKFVMGYVDHAIHDENIGGGLLRSRRSCRVTDFETSIVAFRVI